MQIEVLGERYQLQSPIGRGGMATIYRGLDRRMDRVVAIKVLREAYSTDPKFVTRFQREAKAASALQHPNIVQVFDYGQTNGNYFIVMELIEGTDLRRYLRSRGILDIDRAVIIAHDIALGLGAAHRRGIVHRDVKPQNVLVGRDGSIKLTDFGIASVYKDINAERLTTTGMTLGTVQYYAPEQAQGEIVNPAADVYALGIVMYEMLTGRPPFDGDTPVAVAMQHIQEKPTPPSHLNPHIPPALEEIIMRCLEKAPERRFPDGNALARALELLGETEASNGVPTSGNGATSTGQTTVSVFPSNEPVSPPPSGSRRTPPISAPNRAVSGPTTVRSGVNNNVSNLYTQQNFNSQQLDLGPTRSSFAAPLTRHLEQRRGSRAASIITVLILLATLLLLGFSIYLAGVLGFISLSIFSNTPTPTATVQVTVPYLIGLSYQAAQSQATSLDFQLQSDNGQTSGIVKSESPQPGTKAAKGSKIVVHLQPTLIIPDGLVGQPLAQVETALKNAGITNFQERTADPPTDPTMGPDTVVKVNPPSGTIIDNDKLVKVYVVNRTDVTPTAPPVPTPTQTPTPAPTPKPTPTATPSPSPTPTPSLTASPSSFNIPGDTNCTLNGSLWSCSIKLTNTSQNSLNWTASSTTTGVTFSPASGTLSANGTVTVTVTFAGTANSCADPSLTFTGPTNTVTVTVTCQVHT
jgi:serine/threonine protein kinase